MAVNITPSYREFIETAGLPVEPSPENLKETTPLSSEQYIPVVYGLQRVKPPLIFSGISEQETSAIVCVYALSEGPCYGVYRLYVDGQYIQLTDALAIDPGATGVRAFDQRPAEFGTANRAYTTLPGRYRENLYVEFISGIEANSTDPLTGAGYQSRLINTHIFGTKRPTYPANLSLLVVYANNPTDEGPFEDIPEITVDLFGKMVAPASDPTGTTRYSTNPIDCLVDYMTNSSYGAGFGTDIIDTTTFGAQATLADGNVQVSLNNLAIVNSTQYTCNLVLDTGKKVADNINTFLKSYFLLMPYANGTFKLYNEEAASVEVTFNETSIVGDVNLTFPDASSKYNSIEVTYPDAENDFLATVVTFPETQAEIDALVTEDGGIVNKLALSLPSITDPITALRIAEVVLLKSRKQIKYVFNLFKDAYQYQVGDVVNINTSIPKITNQEARIVKMTYTQDDLVKIEAYSHDNAFYIARDLVGTSTYEKLISRKIQPLIPTIGGVLPVVRPTEPINVFPPTTGNPGPGDPGYPGTPTTPDEPDNPKDITPENPTPEPEPPAIVPEPPETKTYRINVSGLNTVGIENELYVGYVQFYYDALNDDIFNIKLNENYHDNDGGQQGVRIQFLDRYFAGNRAGYYAMTFALSHRVPGAKEKEMGLAYELPNGKFGRAYIKQNGYFRFLVYDPANPTNYYTEVDEENPFGETKVFEKRTISFLSQMNGSSTDGNLVYQPFTPLLFIPYGGDHVLANREGNTDLYGTAIISDPADYQKPYFTSGTDSFSFKVRFFYYDKQTFEQTQYLGETTFFVGPEYVDNRQIDLYRANWNTRTIQGSEAPF